MQSKDQAILVAVCLHQDITKTQQSLNELNQLAFALDIEVVGEVIQRATKIDPRYMVGSGKVEEIKLMIKSSDASIVIFDDSLSPTQIKNLEAELDCQIIDRSFLILSIFSQRAKTKQATLEVSLAQKLYLLPRLVGMTKSLSRQGGGSYNAKGPGETKLELNRRLLNREISVIKKELEQIKKQRHQSMKKRNNQQIPIVALVGYTNAGKSAMMNYLSSHYGVDDQIVFEKDMLFATLDTKAKRIRVDNTPAFILIDTVGFISKLPHELVTSFESTLDDIRDADLIIHVIDGKNPDPNHVTAVYDILRSLGAFDLPRINVVTKSDLKLEPVDFDFDYLPVSSKTGAGYDDLIKGINASLNLDYRIYTFLIPYNKGEVLSRLKEQNQILDSTFREDGIWVKASLSPKDQKQLEKYLK